jgi:small conductance mechanosensitive channel
MGKLLPHLQWPDKTKIEPKEILLSLLLIVAIIVFAFLANWLVRRALRRLAARMRERAGVEAGPRAANLAGLVGSLAKYSILMIAALMVLEVAGVNITPILAGAGIAGLALGMGTQTLVRDLVGGFFILLEGQYAAGDMVEINGVVGSVEEIGLRLTKLRDGRGQIHFFPNGAVNTLNRFPKEGPRYSINIPLGATQAESAKEAIESALADFNSEFAAFTSSPRFYETKTLSIDRSLLIYVIEVFPFRQALVLEKLPGRLARGLQHAGLPLPEGSEITVLPIAHEKQ